jgi:hypothetical protein
MIIFVATKNGRTQKFFPPPLLVLLLDPGWIKIMIRNNRSRIRNTVFCSEYLLGTLFIRDVHVVFT